MGSPGQNRSGEGYAKPQLQRIDTGDETPVSKIATLLRVITALLGPSADLVIPEDPKGLTTDSFVVKCTRRGPVVKQLGPS